ncbi:hypothetical protein [Rossellomorea sp. LJF3]|uniref:hypothetical protein n=1 Tax=Rossellomorea sp. LJF3 TaxID=3126099 RepID=UPI00300CDC59
MGDLHKLLNGWIMWEFGWIITKNRRIMRHFGWIFTLNGWIHGEIGWICPIQQSGARQTSRGWGIKQPHPTKEAT